MMMVPRALRNAMEGLQRWVKDLRRGSGELALFPLYKRLCCKARERVFEGELFSPTCARACRARLPTMV